MIARKIEKELQHFHDAHEKRHCRLLAHVRLAKPLSFANLAKQQRLPAAPVPVANALLIPGKTLAFLDEVQECKEIVTAIKFLVEEGGY